MKGYIYTMFAGADPDKGWRMTDPILTPVPTLGACVPNIRRLVVTGDHIFVVSGRTRKVQQYVVGGFQVAEKIDALTAYHRFPENRMRPGPDGQSLGNIVVNADGTHHELDPHDSFERRVENYIVGCNPIFIESPSAVEIARRETVQVLGNVLGRPGTSLHQVMGRWHRLDAAQIEHLRVWLRSLTRRQMP